MQTLKQWAENIKCDVMTLYFAMHHPETPWQAKIIIILVVSYALSPIDLIPDFIPIIGFLDDLLILPIGIFIAIKLTPTHIIPDCRKQAELWFIEHRKQPTIYSGAAIIIFLWLAILGLAWILFQW